MEISKNLSAVLVKFKEERGLSLTEFAEELGISRSALQEYISGEGVPRLSTIVILAQKLGMEPKELLSGTILHKTFAAEEQEAMLIQLLEGYAQHSKVVLQELRKLLGILAENAENGSAGLCSALDVQPAGERNDLFYRGLV